MIDFDQSLRFLFVHNCLVRVSATLAVDVFLNFPAAFNPAPMVDLPLDIVAHRTGVGRSVNQSAGKSNLCILPMVILLPFAQVSVMSPERCAPLMPEAIRS